MAHAQENLHPIHWYTGLATTTAHHDARSRYNKHKSGLPGKANGLVEETACYGS
jgi:hypothetical protein